MEKARNLNLYIIRVFSLICVIVTHFFLNSGFYDEVVKGPPMAIMCIIRSFAIICVPMFIVLTGYLMNQKELSAKYYKGISRILIVYFLCSIIYSIFAKTYLGQQMSLSIFVEKVLSFKGTTYAWYIEMYVGLYCLIPFLNIIFNNLKDQKQANALVITLFCLIGLPSVLNIYKFDSLYWWITPSISNEYMQILPAWWTGTYPIFYYFLGAYLSKYKLKLSVRENIALLFSVVFLDGLFNYYRSNNSEFVWGSWNGFSSASVMIVTCLIFNLMLKIDIKIQKPKVNSLLKHLSNICLGAYLLSAMFDHIFYKILETYVMNIKDRFVFAPVMVILVFVCSMIVSTFVNWICVLIKKVIDKMIRHSPKLYLLNSGDE